MHTDYPYVQYYAECVCMQVSTLAYLSECKLG